MGVTFWKRNETIVPVCGYRNPCPACLAPMSLAKAGAKPGATNFAAPRIFECMQCENISVLDRTISEVYFPSKGR